MWTVWIQNNVSNLATRSSTNLHRIKSHSVLIDSTVVSEEASSQRKVLIVWVHCRIGNSLETIFLDFFELYILSDQNNFAVLWNYMGIKSIKRDIKTSGFWEKVLKSQKRFIFWNVTLKRCLRLATVYTKLRRQGWLLFRRGAIVYMWNIR